MKSKRKKSIRPKTTETIIGEVRYIVTGHFNESGQTAGQIITQLISDRVEQEIRTTERACFQQN